MPESWLIMLGGLLAAWHGLSVFHHARRGQSLSPAMLLGSLVAGYFAYEHFGWMYAVGGSPRLMALALMLSASSPVLGAVLFWNDGALVKFFLKSILFLVLTVAAVVVLWSRAWPDDLSLVIGAGILTGLVPFLPWRGLFDALGRFRRSWRDRRFRVRERRSEARAARTGQQEGDTLRELQRANRSALRTLKAQESRLKALERGEHQERDRLEALRIETIELVRQVREQEVRRIKQEEAHGVFVFHQYLGYLMAEAWRVLRAEIASGARVPPLESDAFFFQVVEELLSGHDFEERYVRNEAGQQAVRILNGYLRGNCSLARVLAKVEELELDPAYLAPVPLPAESFPQCLVEAWLTPHRRQQKRLWLLFEDFLHPRQEEIMKFLEERGVTVSTVDDWCRVWDESPELFVKESEG